MSKRPAPPTDLIRVAGLPAVQALFARRPDDVERLFYEEKFCQDAGPLCKAMAARRKPYRLVQTDELTKIAGTPLHGGIVAVARPQTIQVFDQATAVAWAKEKRPLVVLDGIGNPHNLGAIIRTMAFFGLDRLLISDHPEQAGLSGSAHRVAEGGLDWVSVFRGPFPQSLHALTAAGYQVVGTALDGAQPFSNLTRDKPIAIVLGNEEDGIPPATQKACTTLVKLPGADRVQSLNVSATAAIFVWELVKP